MIEGFEQYTQELTKAEQEIIPLFVEALSRHKGKAQAITNKKMREALAQKCGIELTGARVRKIIAWIRRHGIIRGLIAYGNKGYAVAETREEIVRGVAGILSRANSIRDTALAMIEQEGITEEELYEYYKEYYSEEINL